MIRDRLRRVARRLRGAATASAPAGGVGAGFTASQAPEVSAVAALSDAAFARLAEALEPLPEPAHVIVSGGLEKGARGVRAAVRKGVAAGQETGQLGHVTAPLAAALRDAAKHLDAAWEAAEDSGAPASGRSSLGVFRDAAGRFGGAMARLPMQPALGPALAAALERWEGMVASGLERAVQGEAGPDET
ncbi:MAG: hypothetical protein VX265_15310 [Myxococcota bacterium]|nr:hypothetical protein [Myxococcota bacterium]MEC8422732.1 hypothetical protein [Myxococcota bacterium]